MKKILLPIFLITICLFTGCGSEKGKTMTCTRTMNQSGIKFDFNYTVDYKDDYVMNLKTVEKVISDNAEILESYKEQVEAIYAPYDGIEYYDYDVKIDGDTLTSTLNINYSKIDTDKMIEVDATNKKIIKDGKIKLADVESTYKKMGFSCEK